MIIFRTKLISILILILVLSSCQNKSSVKADIPFELPNKISNIQNFENFHTGKSYLPVYSHIYHVQGNKTFNLTITVSIRNVSISDSLHILTADYYNTKGDKIREYLKNPIVLNPLETAEIVIAENDNTGGSGANFLFDWAIEDKNNSPLIEAVMISTYGQQGLSFSTRGVQVFD